MALAENGTTSIKNSTCKIEKGKENKSIDKMKTTGIPLATKIIQLTNLIMRKTIIRKFIENFKIAM